MKSLSFGIAIAISFLKLAIFIVQFDVQALAGKETLMVMISGVPAFGKGYIMSLSQPRCFLLTSFHHC